jgi:hypothetical protein
MSGLSFFSVSVALSRESHDQFRGAGLLHTSGIAEEWLLIRFEMLFLFRESRNSAPMEREKENCFANETLDVLNRYLLNRYVTDFDFTLIDIKL